MTVFDRGAAITINQPSLEAGMVHHTLPGFMYLPPVKFYLATKGQRDTLHQGPFMTVANTDEGTLQTYSYDRWVNFATYAPVPTAGDTLTYDPNTGTWVPTPTSQAVVQTLRVYGSGVGADYVFELKLTYSTLVKTGTGTGTLTLAGVHTLTGAVNASYRVDIDSTGTTSWDTATFKWSADAGATYTGTNVPVASGSTSGRKTLQPILLQDGVYVLFSNGTYVAADRWTFTIIAADNQVRSLALRGSLTLEAQNLTVSAVAAGSLELNPGPLTFGETGSGTEATLTYVAADATLTWNGVGAGNLWRLDHTTIAATGGMYLYSRPFNVNEIATPSTPDANNAKFYAKDGGGSVTDPYWLDASGVERNLATGQHPLNTGDPHTQYPLAASAETIAGNWTFTGRIAAGSTSAIDTNIIANLKETFTVTSGTVGGIYAESTITPSGASTATTNGIYGFVTTTGATANTGDLYGLRGFVTHLAATATAGTIYGIRTVTSTGNVLVGAAAGVITAINGAEFVARANNTTTGTMVTNLRGLRVQAEFNFANAGGTTVTNMYGGEIEFKLAVAAGTVTTGRGLRVHADNTSAGVLTTGTMLEVAAWPAGPTYSNGPFGMSVFGATSLNWAEGATEIGTLTAATRPTSIPAQLTVSQVTLGNAVQTLRSVATNDDPTETVTQQRVATTNATVTTLQSITIPASTTVQIHARVTARRTGGTAGTAEDGAGYTIIGTFKNVAAAAVQIGATTAVSTHESQAAWDCAFDVTAATARIRVTGAADNNVTWHTVTRTYPVGS
jgi:hypothetical protein